MKVEIKIYLTPEAKKRLIEKAEAHGHIGRGSLSHFLEWLSYEDIAILDSNLKKVLKVLNFKPA